MYGPHAVQRIRIDSVGERRRNGPDIGCRLSVLCSDPPNFIEHVPECGAERPIRALCIEVDREQRRLHR
jgi:hypothetical protein